MARWLRTNRIVQIVLVNIALFVIGLIGFELVAGSWLKGNNIGKLSIISDRTIRYNISGLYAYRVSEIQYSRDKYGLRGTFSHPGEISILTVGGSTTDQRYIMDGETWQDILQGLLVSSGKKIIVGNAGVDGQSTYGHIKNFDWWFPYVPGLHPKYIIFYVGINDFCKEPGYGYDELTANKSFRQVLREKSATYHVVRVLRGIYLAEVKQKIGHSAIDFSALQWVSRPLHPAGAYEKMMGLRLRDYAERLDMLIRKTEQAGAIPVFVTQPFRTYRSNKGTIEGVKSEFSYNSVSVNGLDYAFMMKKLDQVTLAVAKKHNCLCIDLAQKTDWEDADFYDFFHMTPKGAQKVGSFLFEELKEKI